jgi:alanine dehydrogenase
MKKGAVLIDLNVDQGGCFETTESRPLNSPSYNKHGVVHYCLPNITSKVSRTASIALSNVFTPIFLRMGEYGDFKKQVLSDKGLREGVFLYNGMLTKKEIGRLYNLPYQDINLLLAAF